jgi:hypothetical protein
MRKNGPWRPVTIESHSKVPLLPINGDIVYFGMQFDELTTYQTIAE